MLIDSFNRVHDYLRISLTDACNFRCFYCMPNEEIEVSPQDKLMTKEEVYQLAKIFVELGVKKIRLTGGEPLVRKDFGEIIQSLATFGIELTITTNGMLIHRYIDDFKKAGIHSINVSLDSLDAKNFFSITKRNEFQTVFNNIHLLLKNNFYVKVNMVVMRGVNEHEINKFVEWTKDLPLHIRFIEFMPFTANRWMSEKVFTYKEIIESISQEFEFIKLQDEKNATAKKYKALNHQGTFAVISTMSEPFCSTCNRIRLTADGKIKNCLFSKNEDDLLTQLREGKDVKEIIIKNIYSKAKAQGGQLQQDFSKINTDTLKNRSMISIGG